MIFLICVLIAVVAVILYDGINYGWKLLDGETFLKALLFGLLSLAVAVFLWLGIEDCFNPKTETVYSETYEISALADNARYSGHVSGSVFLVQSRVNEELKYSYMYETEDKGFGFKEVDAESCYINYSTDTPYVQINHQDYASGFLRWLLPNCYGKEYIFYIPETAQVIDDYVIDFD